MVNLRKKLKEILKTIHPNIYFQNASEKAQYPYIVYDLPNSFTNEDQEIFNLDVDVWDIPKDGDTTALESLADTVWNTLHKYRYIDDNMQISIYRQNRMTLIDDDPRFKRRMLIFQLKYFRR